MEKVPTTLLHYFICLEFEVIIFYLQFLHDFMMI